AAEKQRPLLLYFRVWHLSSHRDMKKVFDNPPVRNELRDTVNVEVEYGFWPELDRRYRVITPQVCVMCSPDGQEVSRFFVNPVPTEDKFLEWLREAKARAVPPAVSKPATSGASKPAPPAV